MLEKRSFSKLNFLISQKKEVDKKRSFLFFLFVNNNRIIIKLNLLLSTFIY
jgi:hypothetical protein